MIYLYTSLTCFLITVLIHIILHKLFLKAGINALKSAWVFSFGFIINADIIYGITLKNPVVDLAFVSVLLYGILAVDYLLFVVSPYLTFGSPTQTILRMLERKKQIRLNEFLNNFSDDAEIGQRLSSLVTDKLVGFENNRYIILNRGKRFAGMIEMFRKIFNLRNVG